MSITKRLFQTGYLAVVLAGFIASNTAWTAAQQNISGASLSGTVVDPNGAVIVGAVISIRNLATNQTLTTTSDEEGRFYFKYLSVGSYEIRIDSPGFAVMTRPITFSIGQNL